MINNGFYLVMQSSAIQARQHIEVGVTIGGSAGLTNPFRFSSATVATTGGANNVLTAAQYSCPQIIATGSGHPSLDTHLQVPASSGAIYWVVNRFSTANGLSIGAGTSGAVTGIAQGTTISAMYNTNFGEYQAVS
jgi:hypothetical protein